MPNYTNDQTIMMNVKNHNYFHSLYCGLIGAARMPLSIIRLVFPSLFSAVKHLVDAAVLLITIVVVHLLCFPLFALIGRLNKR